MLKIKSIWFLVLALVVVEAINAATPSKVHHKKDKVVDKKADHLKRTRRSTHLQLSEGESQAAQHHNSIENLVNTCAAGKIQPIFDKSKIIETYCRCPSGTYGFLCNENENFFNPCAQHGPQFFKADSRIPSNYFIHCIDNLPYLKKCPPKLIWNAKASTCDFESINVNLDIPNFYAAYSGPSNQVPATSNVIVSTPAVSAPPASAYGMNSQNLALLAALKKNVKTINEFASQHAATHSFLGEQPTSMGPAPHGNAADELVNTCQKGHVQAIWEEGQITGTYCRCPSNNGYGFTCTENFDNPCTRGNQNQFSPADSRLPPKYYIQCNWNIPTLKVCSNNLVWNQEKQACDHALAFYAAHDFIAQQYAPKQQVVEDLRSSGVSYGEVPTVSSVSYGGYGSNVVAQPEVFSSSNAYQTVQQPEVFSSSNAYQTVQQPEVFSSSNAYQTVQQPAYQAVEQPQIYGNSGYAASSFSAPVVAKSPVVHNGYSAPSSY